MNANRSAYPHNPKAMYDFSVEGIDNGESRESIKEILMDSSGLTKREKIAAMAMQGLLASGMYRKYTNHDHLINEDVITKCAIGLTDSLLKELESTDE